MTMLLPIGRNRRRWLAAGALLPLVVVAVATCRLERLLKPSARTNEPVLHVAPTSVRDSARAGSDDTRRATIAITNGGSEGSFEWSAEEGHSWIRLSPREGSVPDTLTITLDPEDLDPGTHEGTVTITAGNPADSQVTIAVTFVTQRPGLQVSPPALEHATHVNSGATFSDTLRVTNGGTGPLVWTARNDRSWVTLGRLAGTGPGTIPVTVNSSGLPAGTHRDEIVVTAPGATGSPKRVDVTLTIFAPGLAVSPGSIHDTVSLGATTPETHTLQVTNSGSGAITWSAAQRQAWVTLSKTSGGAPEDITVTLSPAGLLPGTHSDTIVFTSPEATNDTIDVAVALVVSQPCEETPLTLDAVVTGSLDPGDCQALHRPGSLAELYGFSASAGDTLSLRLSASFDAYLVLIGDGGSVLAQNDECQSPPESGTACIRDFRVPATGRYVVEATSAGPGETGSFTLSVVRERPPNAPQAIGQFRLNGTTAIGIGGTTPEDGVVIKGTVADSNAADSVRLEVEIEPLGAPFTGVPTHVGDPVPASSGTVTTVRATGLQDDAAFHWQARACDRTGRCSVWLPFGANAESDADFNVAVPDPGSGALGQFQSDGVTPILVRGEATRPNVVLTVAVNDPDPGDVLRLEIEVKETAMAFKGQNLLTVTRLASGSVGSASFPQPNPNSESDPDFRGG